ncbi:hypothetical protein [Tessaracoccus sp. Y1736]
MTVERGRNVGVLRHHCRWLLAVVAVVALVTQGCSVGPLRVAGPEATVKHDGFVVDLDRVTITGPSGVAPDGTEVRLEARKDDPLKEVQGVELEAAFDVAFEDGSQPLVPVTVELDLSGITRNFETLFFVTQRSDTGAWEGLPVTVTGNTASVRLPHFSGGWFGWGDEIGKWFVDHVRQFLKVGFPKPACVGEPAHVGGRTFNVSAKGGVFACVDGSEGKVVTSIYSDSPFVWRYRPQSGHGTGRAGEPAPDLASILTLLAYNSAHENDFRAETVLVPGGNASIELTAGMEDAWTGARVDPGLGLIAVLVAAIDTAAAMASGQTPATWLDAALTKAENADAIRHAGECLAGVIEGSLDISGRLGAIGNTVLACSGTLFGAIVGGAAGAVVGVAVGIITSLIGLLVTQVWGIIGELTQSNEVLMHVTSDADEASPVGAFPADFRWIVVNREATDNGRLEPFKVCWGQPLPLRGYERRVASRAGESGGGYGEEGDEHYVAEAVIVFPDDEAAKQYMSGVANAATACTSGVGPYAETTATTDRPVGPWDEAVGTYVVQDSDLQPWGSESLIVRRGELISSYYASGQELGLRRGASDEARRVATALLASLGTSSTPGSVPKPNPAGSEASNQPKHVVIYGVSGKVVFDHFTVELKPESVEYAVRPTFDVEVCLLKPADPDDDGTTRVSPNPWKLVTTEGRTLQAQPSTQYTPYPAEARLNVGDCASGFLDFPATRTERSARLTYANSVGESAVWEFSG